MHKPGVTCESVLNEHPESDVWPQDWGGLRIGVASGPRGKGGSQYEPTFVYRCNWIHMFLHPKSCAILLRFAPLERSAIPWSLVVQCCTEYNVHCALGGKMA